MSIKNKLMISVILLIAVFSIICGYLVFLLNKQGQQTVYALQQPLIAVTSSQHAMGKFEQAIVASNKVLSLTTPSLGTDNVKAFETIQQEFEEHLLNAQKNSLSQTSHQVSDEIRRKAGTWFDFVVNYISGQNQTQLQNMTLLKASEVEVSKLLTEFADLTLSEANALSSEVQATTQGQTIGTVTAVVVFAVLALVFSIIMVSRMIAPLNKLQEATYELAHGDGDLTRRLQSNSNDEVGALSDEFNGFIEKVQNIIKQVASSAWSAQEQLATLSGLSTATKAGTESQKREIVNITDSMSELVQIGEQVKLSTELAKEQANSIYSEAQNGAKLVKESDQGIQVLTERVMGTSDVIVELNNASDDINAITSVIENIADQTNLLALNAAIEAARAGEAGRGFSVVAEEVRNLAMKTQESTLSIQETVTKVQGLAEKANTYIQESRDKADSCIVMNTKVTDSLQQVLNNVEQVSNTTNEVTNFTTEQELKALSVNEYLEQIRNVADDTASGSSQLLASQTQVAQAIEDVVENISTFKLQQPS